MTKLASGLTALSLVGVLGVFSACAAPPEPEPEATPEVVGQSQEALFGAPRPFDVTFTDCEDTAGITPVARAAGDRVVPDGYTMSGTDTAAFIVRLASCKGVSVEGSRPQPATVVQVGVTVVAPDGNTANINNYTGWYYTDHLLLALRLAAFGVDVQWTPLLRYAYAKNASGTGGSLLVKVPGRLTIEGTVGEPTATPVRYVSHWWAQGPRGRVDMTSVLPAISFGTAPVLTVTTPPWTEIAELLGGTSAQFQTFHSFSRSTPEFMHVEVVTP